MNEEKKIEDNESGEEEIEENDCKLKKKKREKKILKAEK